MWSFGCVAAELAMGCPLFQSKTTTEQILLIMRLLGTPTQQEVMKMNGDFSMAEFQLFPKIKAKNLKDVKKQL
jgi:glycogen synthase kinase 3 beta